MEIKYFRKYPVHRHTRRMLTLFAFVLKFGKITYLIIKYILEPLLEKKETGYNSWVRQVLIFVGGSSTTPADYPALKSQITSWIDYFNKIIKSDKSGKPVVWVDWCFSNEILRAFDVVTYVCETPALVSNFLGTTKASMMFEKAETEGVPLEICSGSKGTVGAYLLNDAPEPDLIISTTHPCDSTASIYQLLKYMTQAKTYVLDTPYWDDKESFDYYAKNMSGVIRFIEEELHQKINWDILKHVCENINTTNFYMSEVTEMSRAIPSPISVMHLLMSWLGRIVSYGSDEGVEAAKKVFTIAKAKLEKKEGHLENEKIRIIWWDIPLGFYNVHTWLERKHGAVTVADMIGRVEPFHIDTSSQESMIMGLAVTNLRAAMGRHMRGPVEFVTNEMERVISEFSADCLIFSEHVGCTHQWAISKITKDICRRAGLPALFLNADIFDARHTSEYQIKRQITAFFINHGLA